ncbi:MAG: C_GCAxxG_C_C family protein [Coriobacteriaceae bacterium]|nr:C_GCAxxG_C_C family protein [Coriobacteriaceae bacterium]
MTSMSREECAKKALEFHGKGFNCAQAIVCTFADSVGIDEATAFKLAEGLGGGLATHTETCGALAGACAIAGCTISEGPHNPTTKARTYELIKPLVRRFREEYASSICSDLKGLTGNLPKRPCDDYIVGAALMTYDVLHGDE